MLDLLVSYDFIFVDQKRVIKSVTVNILNSLFVEINPSEWKQLPLRVSKSILAPTLLLYRILHKARASKNKRCSRWNGSIRKLEIFEKISTRLHWPIKNIVN